MAVVTTSVGRMPTVLAAGVAIALHTAVGFGFLLVGLIAPWYGTALLWAVWGALLVLAVHLVREHPVWALGVPPVAAVAGFAVLLAGEHLLGWMA